MTIYSYRCLDCRAEFDLNRPMEKRNEPAECRQCGGMAERVITAPQAHKGVWARPQDPEALRTTKEIWE